MLKNFYIILFLLLFTAHSFSAGSDPKPAKVKTGYAKAVDSIKFAKNLKKKVNWKKPKKDMKKHKKFF